MMVLDVILSSPFSTAATAPRVADCATEEDARTALAGGAQILGTTLSGYTEATRTDSDSPDLVLVRALVKLGGFVMAEGRYNHPDLAAAAMVAGAHSVTVGSALTRLEIMTGLFSRAVAGATARAVGAAVPDGFTIDLGGTKIAAARFEGGVNVAQLRRETDGFASAGVLIEAMASLVEGLGYRRGARLGVAVTGKVDAEGRWQAVNRATLGKVNDIALHDMLAARLGPATVLNDAAAATLAEARIGFGRGLENFAFVTVSTGVGGGLLLKGRLHRSTDGLVSRCL